MNPSTPINVNYESLKSYFDDNQSDDRAQKLLEKVNKAIAEEYYPIYVSGFIYSDINEKSYTTYQDDLCSIIRIINFEIRVPISGNISSTRRREPSYSNINNHF